MADEFTNFFLIIKMLKYFYKIISSSAII